MKRLSLLLALLYYCNCFSQTRLEYGNFIQTNNNITWAAETDVLFNLMPKTAKYSVKNFYLKKLKDSGITVYTINDDKYSVTSTKLTNNKFKEENFDTISSTSFSNTSFQVILDIKDIDSKYATCICDSCARNELFEIFKVKQIICYGNGDLYIKNILISPLCLKRNKGVEQSNILPLWNVLFNVAFSDGNERKSEKESLLYLGEEEYDYDEYTLTDNKNKLTPIAPQLIKLIFDDCKKGTLKIFDPEKGIEIPYKKLTTWGMPKIAAPIYDTNGNLLRSKDIVLERNINRLNNYRIMQDFYFDKKNEVLLSLVKWIEILEPIYTGNGVYIGKSVRFKFYPKNKK